MSWGRQRRSDVTDHKYVVGGIVRISTRPIRSRYFHNPVLIERTTGIFQRHGILRVNDVFGPDA